MWRAVPSPKKAYLEWWPIVSRWRHKRDKISECDRKYSALIYAEQSYVQINI